MKLGSPSPTTIRMTTGIGLLALALMAMNLVLFFRNQSLQADVNQRQQFINEGATYSRLSEGLVRELATAAENYNDSALRDLLHQQGIDYTVTPNTAAGTAPAPSPRPAGK